MKWTTTKLIALGGLAALRIILSLPGIALAAVTGVPFLKNLLDFPIQPILAVLVVFIIKRPFSATLWAGLFALIGLPLPFLAPPGLLLKIPYAILFGLVIDLVYFLTKRWERISAIVIGATVLGAGIPLAVFFWTILGAPELAQAAQKFLTVVFVPIMTVVGGALGFIGYLIYKRVKNTAVVRRIQGG